jgi:hypothetical protein
MLRLLEGQRNRLFIYVCIMLALTLVGALVSPKDQGPSWSVLMGSVGLIISLGIEIYFQVLPGSYPVEIIRGAKKLRDKFEEMREHGRGGVIKAVWSADYPDVRGYFQREFADLRRRGELRVLRLVNPTVIRGDDYQAYLEERQSFAEDDPAAAGRYEWCHTNIREFETFIRKHEDNVEALFVLNDPGAGSEPLGFYVSSHKGGEGASVARAVDDWFDRLPREVPP